MLSILRYIGQEHLQTEWYVCWRHIQKWLVLPKRVSYENPSVSFDTYQYLFIILHNDTDSNSNPCQLWLSHEP